ncbi:trehalase-like [Metopolophium dirhodum]|uniref:trehalase-like n=1 Tax=Metopolophium dirhodum TaxID=44670 RepID=UPI00298FB696|nr:trehalase-like [Metopolophium dirhodum]
MMDVKYFIIFQVFFTFGTWSSSANVSTTAACDSKIFCQGSILHTVQMSGLFHDSKTFVDMKTKCNYDVIKQLFNSTEWSKEPNNNKLNETINTCFEKEDSELIKWIPTDWVKNPKFLESIKDNVLKGWAYKINLIWKELGRTIIDDVRLKPTNYSLIYVPNPFIIPGGRFREIYYWDSFWIIRGLLICEMHITAKGMISNYISMIKTFGHVPNGGRIYYAKRSQPPMITPMIKSYVDATNDMTFVIENIHALEIEFQYWMTQHNVTISKNGKNYTLAVYRDYSTGPRPESYREDITKAQFFKTESERENFYSEIKAAAESGWDFSSRWFILNGTNKGNITNTKTRSIVPVELNALMFWNAKILSDFYREMNNTVKALKYEKISLEWNEAVTAVLWDEEIGVWLDFDVINNIKRKYFYPTNISPLWTGCYAKNQTEYFVTRVLDYLNQADVLKTLGGIPTTLSKSDEQWDQPNAWPPLQYITVMALESTGHKDAKKIASELASKWLCTNYVPFYNTSKMYEKVSPI